MTETPTEAGTEAWSSGGGGSGDVCTAAEFEAQPLFTPPCSCSRCAPDRVYGRRQRAWLRVAGRAQRYRVELVELGETGRAAL
ncbi:MAG: hypothetical protein ACFCVK_11330 [Acidimicrobiales bacterium]